MTRVDSSGAVADRVPCGRSIMSGGSAASYAQNRSHRDRGREDDKPVLSSCSASRAAPSYRSSRSYPSYSLSVLLRDSRIQACQPKWQIRQHEKAELRNVAHRANRSPHRHRPVRAGWTVCSSSGRMQAPCRRFGRLAPDTVAPAYHRRPIPRRRWSAPCRSQSGWPPRHRHWLGRRWRRACLPATGTATSEIALAVGNRGPSCLP